MLICSIWKLHLKLLADGVRRSRKGEDKGDHPPITPMRPDNGLLSGGKFLTQQ